MSRVCRLTIAGSHLQPVKEGRSQNAISSDVESHAIVVRSAHGTPGSLQQDFALRRGLLVALSLLRWALAVHRHEVADT